MNIVNFRPVGITAETISSLVKKQETDALALYTAYFEIADWQNSWRVYATSKFMQERLGWGKTKFTNAKKVLLEMQLVEDYIDRDESGQAKKHYVQINQLVSEPVSAVSTGWVERPVDKTTPSAVNVKGSAVNVSKDICESKEKFNKFRVAYKKNLQGKVRGNEVEFDNFRKKHKDWEKEIDKLLPGLRGEWVDRRKKQEKGEFVPPPKNLQTWINNRCWEYEL